MAIVGSFIVPHPPLILPEIGQGKERGIQKTIDSYHQVGQMIAKVKPDTIVIISPHSTCYQDYIHISPGEQAEGDFAEFGYPNVKMKAVYDTEFSAILEDFALQKGVHAGTEGEQKKDLDHAVMIPLRFIETYLSKFKIVRIGISGLTFGEHYQLGTCIREVSEKLGRRTAVIASGDLSHRLLDRGAYEYAAEGPEYDKKVIECMNCGDFKELCNLPEEFCEKAGECGQRAFVMLAGALEGMTLASKLLSYEGPFGVGYAVAAFFDAFVSLARQSYEYYVRTNKKMNLPIGLSRPLTEEKAGVFVSLKKERFLRGCIGTIVPVQNSVAEEIIENAISAAVWDPRFPPVGEQELDEIICTVDILSKSEKIESTEQLDIKKYGVIVTKDKRRGLLLPNLEGIETVGQQISIALQKAGIEAEEEYLLERFEVVRHY